MPTTITIPVAERTKSIQYGAAYSSALSFNPDKALLVGCSAVLSGMGVSVNTGPSPAEATVGIGAFIQNGITVNITSPQTLQFPGSPTFPLYLLADNLNETYNSDTKIQFFSGGPLPPDAVVIAEWAALPLTDFTMPIGVSNCALRDAISGVQMLIIQRDRQVAGAGQTVFTLAPGKSYVQGANKIWVYRNGKKLDITNDYVETSTTSVTIFMPAISGDIFEFLIFKGAPPVMSLALDDLTDVTTDLANAIKDVSVLRTAPATAANPLATMADLPAYPGISTAYFSYRWGPGVTPPASFSTGAIGFTPKVAFVYTDLASAVSHGMAFAPAAQEMLFTTSDLNTDYWSMSLNSLDSWPQGSSGAAPRILGGFRAGFAQFDGAITVFGPSGISFVLTIGYKHPSYAMNMRVLVLG